MKPWLMSIGLSVIAIFAPAKQLFAATIILILADLITGIWAAYKLGAPISSAAIRRTVSKLFIYNIAIGAGFLVQHYLMTDALPVSNIVSSAIGLTELKSIIENADKINGGSLMKLILAKLGSVNDTLQKPTKES